MVYARSSPRHLGLKAWFAKPLAFRTRQRDCATVCRLPVPKVDVRRGPHPTRSRSGSVQERAETRQRNPPAVMQFGNTRTVSDRGPLIPRAPRLCLAARRVRGADSCNIAEPLRGSGWPPISGIAWIRRLDDGPSPACGGKERVAVLCLVIDSGVLARGRVRVGQRPEGRAASGSGWRVSQDRKQPEFQENHARGLLFTFGIN